MAATYNGSVANLVDPLANSPLNSPSHAGQHTEINDALQTLGVWQAYTPTWTNFTSGNATIAFRYCQFNNSILVRGRVTLGSTSAVTGEIGFTLPVTAATGAFEVKGTAVADDFGTALFHLTPCTVTTTRVSLFAMNATSTYIYSAPTSATVPFSWTNGDSFWVNLFYEAA